MAPSPSSAAHALTDVTALLGGETQRSRRFLGGLIAGALVGAAIAGSVLVRRRPPTRRGDPPEDGSIETGARR